MFEDHIYRLMVRSTCGGELVRPLDYVVRHSTFADRCLAESKAQELDKTKPDIQGKHVVIQFRSKPGEK